jgi:hypothetical protein
VAYGVAGGDDEGAEDAAVLGGVEADAAHDEGVVTGGAQDVRGGGRGLEGPPHRFRVHGAAAALRPAGEEVGVGSTVKWASPLVGWLVSRGTQVPPEGQGQVETAEVQSMCSAASRARNQLT